MNIVAKLMMMMTRAAASLIFTSDHHIGEIEWFPFYAVKEAKEQSWNEEQKNEGKRRKGLLVTKLYLVEQ